ALLQGPFLLVRYILKMKHPMVTAVLVVLVQVSQSFPALYHRESICGSEGKTYENICQFNKAYATKRNISMKHKGPCESGNMYRGTSKLKKDPILIFRCVTRYSSLLN
uniref:Kazal-like domain-containing protein n=1 Tax=Buteo japonicus TaxID=224669 RepID=A0A8C0BFX5_9AVES